MSVKTTTFSEKLKKYGRPIMLEKANVYFKNGIDIHRKFGAYVEVAIRGVQDATPEEKADALALYTNVGLGHIFSYEMIKALYEKMQGAKQKSYLLLYEALRKEREDEPPSRRTIIAMVYDELNEGQIKLNDVVITVPGMNERGIGTEHPGTKPPKPGNYEIPGIIDESDIGAMHKSGKQSS